MAQPPDSKKPLTVNLSKDTLDKITPALQSMRDSLKNQTRLLNDTFNLQKTTLDDKLRADQLGQSALDTSSSGSSGGTGSTSGGITGGGGGGGVGGILSGMMGGLGGMGAGLGMGGGALMAGLGVLAGGGGYLLSQLQDLDGKKVRSNISELLNIKDDFDGVGDFFLTGGAFLATLTGMGVGLGVFAIGGSAAAGLAKFGTPGWTGIIKDNVKDLLSLSDEIDDTKLAILGKTGSFFTTMSGLGIGLGLFGVGGAAAAALTKFETTGWTTTLKDNVKTLLEIPDLPNANLGGALSFVGVMSGLSAGLAVFALGQGVAGVVGLGTAGVEFFTGESQAQGIKDEVETLLSIPSLPNATLKDVTGFIGVMAGLGAGLGVFALGKGAEGITEVGQAGLTYFTDNAGFAQRVKTEVETLLSIPDLPNATLGNVTGFLGVMGSLAGGLVAFSAAKGISGAITFFTGGEEFATGLKTEVGTLLSITEGQTDDGSTFNTAMGNISTGLLKFTGGSFGASLVNIGTSMLNFLSGDKSPIEKVLSIAENAGKLTLGAKALGDIADNLNKFSAIKFDGADFNIKGFANDLKEAVPIIEKSIMGDDGGWFGTEIKGLASPDIDYASANQNIIRLREALGLNISEKGTVVQMNALEDVQTSKAQSSAGVTVVNSAPTYVTKGGNQNNTNYAIQKPMSLATATAGFN